MARNVTIVELRTQARQRADMENTQYVSDTEVNTYLNASLAELYDLLVATFDDYYLTSVTINLSANQELYPLPSDFYKVLGVDLDTTANFNNPISLRAFSFADRNRNSFYGNVVSAQIVDLQYHVQGQTIRFIPNPIGSGVVKVWYIPTARKLKPLSTDSNKPNGFSYSFTDSAVSTSADTVNIANHGYRLGDRINFSNVGGALPTPISSGTDLYALPVTDNTFRISASVSDAHENVYLDITSASGGGTHYINDDQDKFDGVNGYEEFVIWDVAMRLKAKEESDVSVEMAEKQRLIRRIQESATQRDVGEPWRVTDVYEINSKDLWD